MKTLYIIFIFLFILASCGREESPTGDVPEAKVDFFVETKLWSEFLGGSNISKVGQVRSSQDIAVSATTNGRVNQVLVKPWDSVFAWQVIARLTDSFWNLWTAIDRWANSIERAQINYDSQALSLDKQIFDAEVQLSNLERSLETAKKDGEQNLLQAEDAFQNSQYEWLDSVASLQIEQLDNNIAKSRLDYENSLVRDQQTIAWYRVSLKNDASNIRIFLTDIIQFSDELLGVSELNRSFNDDFEFFLWAKDTTQRSISRNTLIEMIGFKEGDEFLRIEQLIASGDMTEQEIIESIDFISAGYDLAEDLLNNIEITVNNSLRSVWTLWDQEINTFLAEINGFQSQLQSFYGGFTSFSIQVKSFLATYQNQQASLLKSIELQEKDRDIQLRNLQSGELGASTSLERTEISIQDTITNLEEQVRVARNNLENAKQNKTLTLRSLSNSISEAQISYSSAAKDLAKLTITSPINGTISEVSIDVGQEVFSNAPLFEIVSDSTPEVEIALSKDELSYVSTWEQVVVEIWDESITGSIYAISEVADASLNYKTTIVFDAGTNIIGNIVNVLIPIETWKMLFPLNILEVQWDDIALVKTLSWSTFSDVRVRMWDVYGGYSEIVSCAQQCEELKIITNDISNFDANKFNIVEK